MIVALQVLRRLLLRPEAEDPGSPASTSSVEDKWASEQVDELYKIVYSNANGLVKSLVAAASQAAALSDSQTLENALATVTDLLSSTDVASQLTGDPQSKILLATSLRSRTEKVRTISSKFALLLGRAQPIVFSWLIDELDSIDGEDSRHGAVFQAVKELLENFKSNPQDIDLVKLANLLSSKILSYPALMKAATVSSDDFSTPERFVLQGYLDLYAQLLKVYPGPLLEGGLGSQVYSSLLSQFLFSIPTNEDDKTAICNTARSRKAAFDVLNTMVYLSPEAMGKIIEKVEGLLQTGNMANSQSWQLQLSHDLKSPSVPFCGLKNQGCTCYMNSLLQQLFMCKSFREAILSCKLKECYRTSIKHRSDADIVGAKIVYISNQKKTTLKCEVLNFDPVSRKHTLKQIGADKQEFAVSLKRTENTLWRVLDEEENSTITKADEDAFCVLDQLQRTFCYLENSKKRFFNPKDLVNACATLNMNYPVHQQNDVTEFFDQLSDRIETATKTEKVAGLDQNVWKDVVMKDIFNGKTLYQKVPRDCVNFETDRSTCGHWQSARDELAPKIQLNVRNLSDVHEALAAYFASELMDGENKIQCEVCCEKKTTLRRTVMGTVPNTLVLHLKRFDLDYETFETVKLNNRLDFPLDINVLRYTKEGIESEERRVAKEAAEKESHTPEHSPGSSPRNSAPNSPSLRRANSIRLEHDIDIEEPDPDDYEYELQGVVVHAGIAGGGHYYSFARDADHPDNWYRFDDDDVSSFQYSPETIAYECFGGAQVKGSDIDRSTNALMLFYTKKRQSAPRNSPKMPSAGASAPPGSGLPGGFPDIGGLDLNAGEDTFPPPAPAKEADPRGDENPQNRLINGREAYLHEVRDSNLQHILSQYLFDTDLHSFVRSLLYVDTTHENAERLLKFGLEFLLSTVLRCKDKLNMNEWIDAVNICFTRHPSTVKWFLNELIQPNCAWLNDYIYACNDSRSSHIFSSIIIKALECSVPTEENGLTTFQGMTLETLQAMCAKNFENNADTQKSKSVVCACLAMIIRDSVHTKVVNNILRSQQVFVLLRKMAMLPPLRIFLVSIELVSSLVYFAICDKPLNPSIANRFKIENKRGADGKLYKGVLSSADTQPVLGLVTEVIAALIGIPQPPKVSLLADRKGWEYTLTQQAKEAVRTIFMEASTSDVMYEKQLRTHFEAVNAARGIKFSAQQAAILYSRLTKETGFIRLKQFMQFMTEEAFIDEQNLWEHLTYYRYRNDLSRADANASNFGVTLPEPPLVQALILPDTCAGSLGATPTGINFHLLGQLLKLSPSCEAILMQTCMYKMDVTMALLEVYMHEIQRVLLNDALPKHYSALIKLVQVLLTIPDGNNLVIMSLILSNEKYGFLAMYKKAVATKNNFAINECIVLLKELYTKPSTRILMDTIALHDPDVAKMLEFLKEPPETDWRNSYCKVEGAGIDDANGIYAFKDFMEGSVWYQKCLPKHYSVDTAQVNLYKCKMIRSGMQWFISRTPTNRKPGTNADEDLYTAILDKSEEKIKFPLPALIWEPHTITYTGSDKFIPTVTVAFWDANDDIDGSLDSIDYENENIAHGYNLPHSSNVAPQGQRGQNHETESDSEDSTKGRCSVSSGAMDDDQNPNTLERESDEWEDRNEL